MEEKLEKKAILVGVKLSSNPHFEMEMEELAGLANAIGIEVVGTITQPAESINNKYYIRSGKLEELKNQIDVLNAGYVIFNDELSGAILSNLNKEIDSIIYDRTYLILEIFKQRANTKEARLQVEIATLIYMKSRLKGLREGLSRQRGGSSSGGAYGKGRGETQLEIDRRNVGDRIVMLRNELKECIKERQVQRKKRTKSSLKVVSLVGYTNAGKSSMINYFMNKSVLKSKDVFEKDMLFATLETSSRLINLKDNHSFILTDTVGFISKLPTTLVDAFKSTLEEIKESDLLIHVVDSSNPDFEIQINTTNSVLKEIGVDGIETIYAFNKIDKTNHPINIPKNINDYFITSVKTDDGMSELEKKILKSLFNDEEKVVLLIPYQESKVVSQLKSEAVIESIEKLEQGLQIKCSVNKVLKEKLKQYIKKIS